MDSQKVEIRDTKKYGQGVFAREGIYAGEIIASFDGNRYDVDPLLHGSDANDHAIQYGPSQWRDSKGIARLINHACDPNCGLRNMFDIVAMRDISKGEEITWDYEMTEDTDDWRFMCSCGSPQCRGVIGAFRNMPIGVREKYKGYIADWLVKKYHL